MTAKDRIENIITSLDGRYQTELSADAEDYLRKEVLLILRKSINPEMVCKECDEILVTMPGTGTQCINCGWKPEVKTPVQNTPRTAPTKKGKTIPELVGQLGTGASGDPTEEETKLVSGGSGGVKWV